MLKKRKFKGKLAILLISAFVCIFTFIMSIPKTYAWTYNDDTQIFTSENLFNGYGNNSIMIYAPSHQNLLLEEYSIDLPYNTTHTYYVGYHSMTINDNNTSKYIEIYRNDTNVRIVRRSLVAPNDYAYFSFSTNANSIKFKLVDELEEGFAIEQIMLCEHAFVFDTNGYNANYFEPYNAQYLSSKAEIYGLSTYTINLYYYDSYNALITNYSTGWNTLTYHSDYVEFKPSTDYTSCKIEIIKNARSYWLDEFTFELTKSGDTYVINYDNNAYSGQAFSNNSMFNYRVGVVALDKLTCQFNNIDNTSSLRIYYDSATYTDGYSEGYNQGKTEGYNQGKTEGYNQGLLEGESSGELSQSGFKTLINTIISYPINMIKDSFNFEFFGINVSMIILFGLTLGIVLFVIKKFWK